MARLTKQLAITPPAPQFASSSLIMRSCQMSTSCGPERQSTRDELVLNRNNGNMACQHKAVDDYTNWKIEWYQRG